MVRRCALPLVALLLTVWALVGVGEPARAADARMEFVGAVDVVGLLDAITVEPAAVTVPAGGSVLFVNGTTAPLTITVGGRSTGLAPRESLEVGFPGDDRRQTLTASATAVNLPVVGTLVSSVGRVTVMAVPTDPDDGPPTTPDGPAPTSPSGSPVPSAPGPSGSGPSSGNSAPPTTTTAGGLGPAAPPGTSDGPSPGQQPSRGTVVASPVLPPFPGFSNTHDQLGLLILLAVVVLAGVASAVGRVVLAYRPVAPVGAHSAARAARADRARAAGRRLTRRDRARSGRW